MTAAVLGLDVSPLRLGWGLVTLDDGRALSCGMTRIDLPHRGWSHEQVAAALREIEQTTQVLDATVTVVGIEWPTPNHRQRGASVVNIGRAMQEGVSAVQRRWPHAPIHELLPQVWKRRAGIPGNAGKPAVMDAALRMLADVGIVPGCLTAQDAADGVLIALAAQRLHVETWDRAVERGAA